MDDLFAMEELESTDQLSNVALRFHLSQPLASLQQLIQGLVLTQFDNHIYVVPVFKASLELHTVFTALPCHIPERFMDCYFTFQL